MEEGLRVQIMHHGPFDDEPAMVSDAKRFPESREDGPADTDALERGEEDIG